MNNRFARPNNQYSHDYHLSRVVWVVCVECGREVQKDREFARRGRRCLPCAQTGTTVFVVEPLAGY